MTKKESLNFAAKYTFRTLWSAEDEVHISRCLEFPSLAAHGNTPEEALKEIQIVVAESVRWMSEKHEEIPEPLGIKRFSGKYPLRLTPELHRELAIRAAEQKVSLNQYIQTKLAS
jgi:predicted HicB family RNase H-like nuclease